MKIKKKNWTTFRVAMGQVGLLVSILLLALMLGLIPDRQTAIREARVSLAETIAVHVTGHATRGDLKQLKEDLNLLTDRNPQLISIGVKRGDHSAGYAIEVGDHHQNWLAMNGKFSSESQVILPIYSRNQRWGQLELRFHSETPWLGDWLSQSQIIPLVLFLSLSSFFVFYLYLGKMLKHLDPSQAIPKRVQAALDTMAEGLLVVDKKSQIVLANGSISRILGRPVEELLGLQADAFHWEIGSLREESADGQLESDSNHHSSPWMKCLNTGQQQRNGIVHLVDKDQVRRTFFVNCSPVMAGEKLGGVLISFDDVTQLEEKKRELGEAKEAAESANKSKSEFLANMSHEIRTPMNAILGFTEVLRRGYNQGQQDPIKYLNTIHSSGTHLLELINDILDLSKVEAGKIDVERIPCSPHQIASDVIQFMQVKAEEKGIDLALEFAGPLPDRIESDPSRIRQIITNLIGNAIKFTSTGGVCVQLELINEDGLKLRIDVIDSGIGMSPEQAAKIFDPFSQADSSVTRKFGGTGLGLTISRRFAQALGGTINVLSKPGLGSVFSVLLDTGNLAGTEMLSPSELKASVAEIQTMEFNSWKFEAQRVLVVDDGKENRDLLALVLQEAGLATHCVENGLLAIEAASSESFDLILMDMQMPVMDGYQATAELRKLGFTLPIFALTAHAMNGFEQGCLDAGCSGFLTKPINIDLLLATIGETLGVAPANDQKTKLDSLPPEPTIRSSVPTNTTSEAPPTLTPVLSSLPTDRPEFAEIVESFTDRLDEEILKIEQAFGRQDFDTVARLAHWLKGTAGTVGFADFTPPTRDLESATRNQDTAAMKTAIEQIKSLSNRIPKRNKTKQDLSPPPEPLVSQLPTDNPQFLKIVRDFVPRLSEQLSSLDQVAQQKDFKQLGELAHWLKGAAGTIGFPQFTVPATRLEELAGTKGDDDEIQSLIEELRGLSSRIRIPELENLNQTTET